jgi:hypothetical protein
MSGCYVHNRFARLAEDYVSDDEIQQKKAKSDKDDKVAKKAKKNALPSIEELDTKIRVSGKYTFEAMASDKDLEKLKELYPYPQYTIYMKTSEESKKTLIVINDRGFPNANMLDIKLEDARAVEKNYVDFLIVRTQEEINAWFSETYPDNNHYGLVVSETTRSRVFKVRIFDKTMKHENPNKNKIPTKEKLDQLFKKSDNSEDSTRCAIAHLILEKQLLEENKRIHGYKYILSKNQPEDNTLVNVIVFEKDKKKDKEVENKV